MRIYSTLRHYTMLLGVCCHFKDVEGEATDLEEVVYVVVGVCIGKASNLGFCIAGGLRVLALLESRGFKADCMFYTTLVSVCSKAGKVDLLFQV
jgi:dienelactone hydrolase